MPRRQNYYSGYSNPQLGEAFDNLASAMFGSAQTDAYAANARANRALALEREIKAQGLGRDQEWINQGADSLATWLANGGRFPEIERPLPARADMFGAPIGGVTAEAVPMDTGMVVRPLDAGGQPVGPLPPTAPPPRMDPTLGVDGMPTVERLPDMDNFGRLARLMIARGEAADNLSKSVGNLIAQQALRNDPNNALSALPLLGINPKEDTALTSEMAARIRLERELGLDRRNMQDNATSERNNQFSVRQREAGANYRKNLDPIIVPQNSTAYVPPGRSGFGGQTLRGQQGPVTLSEGQVAILPEERQADFGGAQQLEGRPKTPRTGSGGGAGGGKPVKITGADTKAIDSQIVGAEKTLTEQYGGGAIPSATKSLLRDLAAERLRNGSDDERSNIPLATSRAIKEFYGKPFVYNPTLGRKVIVPERVILEAQQAISSGAPADKVYGRTQERLGIPTDALKAAIENRNQQR